MPAPAPPSTPQGARSCGLPSVPLAVRRDTLGDPLVRLRPPSRYDPTAPPTARVSPAPSPGVDAPSAHPAGGGHAHLPEVPTPPSTVRSQGSSPLSGFLRPQPPSHFQAGTLMGFALQGFPLPARCRGSSPRHCPLDVAPADGHLRPRTEGQRARLPTCLGHEGSAFDRPQGLALTGSPFGIRDVIHLLDSPIPSWASPL